MLNDTYRQLAESGGHKYDGAEVTEEPVQIFTGEAALETC